MSKENRAEYKSFLSTDIEIRMPKKVARCAWIDNNGNVCGCAATTAITMRSRGGRVVCYCADHADYIKNPRPYYGYTTKNHNHTGTFGNGDGWTFGNELETSWSAPFAYSECIEKKYIPTSDCTVDIEYKSPVYHGLNAFVRDARAIGQLIEDGALEISPLHCGTHTHIGHIERKIDERTGEVTEFSRIADCMRFYRQYSYRLTKPLADEMKRHEDETRQLFGRALDENGYAAYPERNSMEHRNYINMQHNNTLEFRLPLFRNATQYLKCVELCKRIAETFYTNFGSYAYEIDKNGGETENNDLLKHKADVAGNKAVKLFRKYAGIDD